MGFYDRDYTNSRVSFAQERNNLILLIAINIVVFVIMIFIRAVYSLNYSPSSMAALQFNDGVVSWFSLPADLGQWVKKPWTLLTHMFLHIDVWHILGNMLWLWVFGYILHDLTGNRKIIPIYLYGGLAGALAFVAAQNLLPGLRPELAQSTALGASAGVMAVAVAVTTLSPGYRMFTMINGGIPIWIVTTFYLIIDLAFLPTSNTGGHIAHLAGGLAGFLFIVAYQRGVDAGGWMNRSFDWIVNLFNPEKPAKGKSIKQELFYKSQAAPYKRTPNITEKRVDEILDKINQKGLEALSDEEKELLERAARES